MGIHHESRLTLRSFSAGDKTALLGANRPEWVIFDVATMAIAGVPAGIYVTSSPVEVSYILNHSEAKFVLVENKDQWAKVKKEWDAEKLPHLQKAILVDGESDDVRLIEWETFLSSGDNTEDEKVDEIAAALDENALGTLIYTSGTTGPPKVNCRLSLLTFSGSNADSQEHVLDFCCVSRLVST